MDARSMLGTIKLNMPQNLSSYQYKLEAPLLDAYMAWNKKYSWDNKTKYYIIVSPKIRQLGFLIHTSAPQTFTTTK